MEEQKSSEQRSGQKNKPEDNSPRQQQDGGRRGISLSASLNRAAAADGAGRNRRGRGASGNKKAGGWREVLRRVLEFPFLQLFADMFILLVLAGQFLVYDNYYFNILRTKYHYFCACSLGLLGLSAVYGAAVLIFGRRAGRRRKKKISEIFSGGDMAVLAFVLTAAVSTLLSDYRSDAFWGTDGRFTGMFLILLYTGVYFVLTRCYKVRAWHMEMFLAAGLLMCLFGITDFFDLDLLHFKEQMKQSQRYMFTSTIGNINTYTSCVAMVMGVACVLFGVCRGVWKNIWYGFAVVVSFTALIMGESDNAYISLIALFGLLPLYLFRNEAGVRKYFVLLAMFFSVTAGVRAVEIRYADQVIKIQSLFRLMADWTGLEMLIRVLWGFCAVLYLLAFLRWLLAKMRPRKDGAETERSARVCRYLARAWWGVIAAAVVLAVLVIWDVNVAGNAERYGSLKKYLFFDDSWGSHRGFAWRIAVEDYLKFPLSKKIFGSGPDTFGRVTALYNGKEMASQLGVRFDSAHNEFLQYFVTMGPPGLLAYLAILAAAVRSVVKRKLDCPAAAGALFAVLCYNFQAIVNINQAIAAPVMWVLLCICMTQGGEGEKIIPGMKRWLANHRKAGISG